MSEPATTRRDPVAQLREIRERLPRLDYYQILGAEPGDDERSIRKRFYERSRKYHPDRYRTVPQPELRELVHDIYKQVAEAYNVLKEPSTRRRYDEGLKRGRSANLRYNAEEDAKSQREYDGGTGPGAKFYKLARQAMAAGNAAAARNNIKLALSMEADNPHFEALRAEIEQL